MITEIEILQKAEEVFLQYLDETQYWIDWDQKLMFIANEDDYLCNLLIDEDDDELVGSFNFMIDPLYVLDLVTIMFEIADKVKLPLRFQDSWITEAHNSVPYPLFVDEAYEALGYKPLQIKFKDTKE